MHNRIIVLPLRLLLMTAVIGLVWTARAAARDDDCTSAVPALLTGSDADHLTGTYNVKFGTGFTGNEISAFTRGMQYWPEGASGFNYTFDQNGSGDLLVQTDDRLHGTNIIAQTHNTGDGHSCVIDVNPDFVGSNQMSANFWNWNGAHESGHDIDFHDVSGYDNETVMRDSIPSNVGALPSSILCADQRAMTNNYYKSSGGGNNGDDNSTTYQYVTTYNVTVDVYICTEDTEVIDYWTFDVDDASWDISYNETEEVVSTYDCVPAF